MIFLEPKWLYRQAVEMVPEDDFELPLGKSQIIRSGEQITMVGWGAQVMLLLEVADTLMAEQGVSCEVIDLRTLTPWDSDTVEESVRKTGRLIVSHEVTQILHSVA